MLALVTGATGFVGSHLVDLLLARGHRVRAVHRRNSRLAWIEGKAVERFEADLREGTGLDRACEGVDAVFHVAGVINAPREADYRAGNWLATKRVVDAAVAARAKRFVQVSSLAAAGPSPDGAPIDEEAECRPVSIYGRSKLEGEREAWSRRDAIGVSIVRPPVVYGPRDEGLVEMFQLLKAGIKPRIGGEKRLSIVQVGDLVRAVLAAGEDPRAAGQVFFASNEAVQTQDALMELILAALGRRAVTLPVPDRVVRFLGGVVEDAAKLAGVHSMFHRDKAAEMTQQAWVCTPAKAARLLGWRAEADLARGLAETAAWYRDRGIL